MDFKEARDWIMIGAGAAGWIFSLGFLYSRLLGKIDKAASDGEESRQTIRDSLAKKVDRAELDGVGARVTAVEGSCSESKGRMDRFEKELAEYRGDARNAADKLSRVEAEVKTVAEAVRDGNIALGVQLTELNKSIQTMDKNTTNRLVRLETVTAIEKKVGPLPED